MSDINDSFEMDKPSELIAEINFQSSIYSISFAIGDNSFGLYGNLSAFVALFHLS